MRSKMLSNAFYEALALRESKNDPQCVNEYGFMGLYQMGQRALRDVGYMYMASNNRWTGKNGIRCQQDFLGSRSVQDSAIREYHQLVWNNYLSEDVKNAVGSTVKNIRVTKSGIVAAAHLVGQEGIKDFIRSNGRNDKRDEIGTTCSEYLRQFGGY